MHTFAASMLPPPAHATQGRSSAMDATCLAFGAFALFPHRQLLTKDGIRVRVGGRAFEVLLVLAARAGEIVSKRELIARAWPGVVVEETNLKVAITGLRKLLGETVDEPRFIATVVGRGYRFVAPVHAP